MKVLRILALEVAETNKNLHKLSDSDVDLLEKEKLVTKVKSLKEKIIIEREKLKSSEFYRAKIELDIMDQSHVYFDILPIQKSLGEARFNGYTKDGVIVIGLYYPAKNILDKIPLVAHELKHGYQFLTGNLAFDKNEGTAALIYDITDEVEAFQREALFIGEGEIIEKQTLSGRIRFSLNSPPKPNEIASLTEGYEKIYDVFGEEKISLSTKFKNISEDGQDYLFYGNKSYKKITEQDRAFDALLRNSDYEIIQYFTKLENIVYNYAK